MKSSNVKVSVADMNFINQDNRLNVIIEKTVDAIKPNKIFLINSVSACYSFTDNCIPDQFKTQTHYNFMVITAQCRDIYTIQETIENNCKATVPLTAFVLPEFYYKHFLEKNEVFANSVLASGKLLYQSENIVEESEDLQVVKDIKRESSYAIKRANVFLSSAEVILMLNELPLAAFNLHQAIEQYCYGSILGQLGVNPKTHNLDKLYRLMRFFTFELVKIFPRDTESEEKLFACVKEAYIASRYSSSYAVKGTDLRTICNRIRTLLKA